MKRRLLRILSITSLVAILLFTMAGIALAVDYYLYVKVSSEQGTSDYAPLALVPDVNNQSLADLGYISESGLDTRVTYAGSELKHMVAEDKLAFVAPEVKGGVDYSYNYTMGNDPLTEFYIIPGYDGYITVLDASAPEFELGNNFEIEQKGWIDTSAGSGKNLVYKQDSFRTYVSAATNITATMPTVTSATFYPDPSVEDTSVDGYVADIGNDVVWATLIAEPGSGSNDSAPSGNVIKLASSATPDQWTELYRGIFLFDTNSLPDDASIVSATFSIYGASKADTNGLAPDLNVYSSSPASNTVLANGDFDSLDSTAFCDTSIPYASFDIAGYNDLALNAAGIAAIDRTGITKLGVRNANYDASGTPPAWPSGNSRINCYFADEVLQTKDPKLVVSYVTGEISVTATGVSSGVRRVVVTATGGGTNLLTISVYDENNDLIDDDSVALAGASVPPNDYNWLIDDNNVMPYMEYYKHTVGGTLIAWYQPNDMISGATLPDREGTAQNGTITWGSLPTGISTIVGSLKIVNLQNISKEAEEGAYLELFQEVPPEWEGMYSGEQYNVLPGSEAISELAAAGQIPIKLFWVPVIFGIAIFAGLYIYGRTKNIMAVAIAGGIVIGLFCAIGMLVWWVIIPYSIMSVALCVSEKTYGF